MTENRDFLTSQIITYLGNKRKLLAPIENGIDAVLNRQFSTKRLVKLLQEEYGGLSTGRAERLTAELNDRADFEPAQ